MNTQEQIEARLWDYIDGLSSPAEKSAIEEMIADNLEWQRKYRELLDTHQLLNATDLDAPSMRFTRNVMEEIARYQVAPATKTYINKNIIRSIGAFFLTMIAGVLILFLRQFNWSAFSGTSSSGSESSTLINSYTANIQKFNWGKIVSGPYTIVLLLITVVLGLVLLDKYLQRKRHAS